jgi:hypothetical protein
MSRPNYKMCDIITGTTPDNQDKHLLVLGFVKGEIGQIKGKTLWYRLLHLETGENLQWSIEHVDRYYRKVV